MAERNRAGSTALVIGAGVIGHASAIALQRAGLAVTLVAPPTGPEASWGNAGHIATEQVEPLASRATIMSAHRRVFVRGGALGLPPRDIAAWLPFSMRLLRSSGASQFAAGARALGSMLGGALPAWRALLETAGAGTLLREEGHFVLWESAATAEAGRRRWAQTDIGATSFRGATREELAQIGSSFQVAAAGAIRFAGSAQIADLPQLARALDAAFGAGGGQRRLGRAIGLERHGARATAHLDDGERLDADIILVAAGVGSKPLLAPLGHHVPIIAERGYHIQMAAPDWPRDLPPIAFEDRSMIVTRFESGLRAASFVEFGREHSPPDPRKWARLRRHATELGLPVAEDTNEWMGARPTLPDYLPAIGRSAAAPNILYAFGHQHLGLTLAAVTGEAVAAIATGSTAPFDTTPFALERF
ncbi:D-amino-acid dehydrogenase [Sphingomonas zeicaulis]|uniref:NAD(P)/FAD-dependent oxidoreductase n=1 Tax=Sphingomonas zeicaulis TaxID=1632740 RepID=UPI003D1AF751